jgi:hypothetical protein
VKQGSIYVLLSNFGPQLSPSASDRYAEVGWANRLLGELHSCFERVADLRIIFEATRWDCQSSMRWQYAPS